MIRYAFVLLSIISLMLPTLTYAGSATSRWDMTLGGFIKFDMGYSTQGQNADYDKAQRGSNGLIENRADKYGSLFAAGGQSRLNWKVRGPGAWGAKTWGFVEGDFRGLSGDYGEFELRHAFMQLDWANDKLIIGHTWQNWARNGTWSNYLLGFNMLSAFDRGSRNSQITWMHDIDKNWGFSLGAFAPSKNTRGTREIDSFLYSGYPFFEGEIKWTSDACGKVRNLPLFFAVGGFYGWDRQIYDTSPAPDVLTYDDDLNAAWGVSLKGVIPIIPERKGNKAGALFVSGHIFAMQNPSWYLGSSFVNGAYNRSGDDFNPRYAYPRVFGGWGQITYYFTDNVHISGWYGNMAYTMSNRYKERNPNAIQSETQYAVNLSYDVNNAMRLGVEWDYIYTKYAGYPATGPQYDKDGNMHAFRVGAWYFF